MSIVDDQVIDTAVLSLLFVSSHPDSRIAEKMCVQIRTIAAVGGDNRDQIREGGTRTSIKTR